jgi:VanZ family protein
LAAATTAGCLTTDLVNVHEGEGGLSTPSRLWVRVAFVGYWVVLATLTHIPRLPQAAAAAFVYDKVVHAVAYGLLAALAWWSSPVYEPGRALRRAGFWLAFLAAYGVADELLQPLTNRSCELGDWIADVVGIVLGLGAAWAIGRNRMRKL